MPFGMSLVCYGKFISICTSFSRMCIIQYGCSCYALVFVLNNLPFQSAGNCSIVGVGLSIIPYI